MSAPMKATLSNVQLRGRGAPDAISFVAKTSVPTLFGRFTVYGFLEKDSGKEHLALVAGEIARGERIDVRIHSECLTGEVLGSLQCDCREQLHAALEEIGAKGGIVLYMRQEGRGIGLLNKIKAYALQEQGHDTVDANRLLGFADDLRDYRAAASILRYFGIARIRLATNNPAKIGAMTAAGFNVVRKPSPAHANPHNVRYLATKVRRSGHLMNLDADAWNRGTRRGWPERR